MVPAEYTGEENAAENNRAQLKGAGGAEMAEAWALAQVIAGSRPPARSFFERRGLRAPAPLPPPGEFKDLFELKHYARFAGLGPDGRAVVVFLLEARGPLERHLPDFTALLEGLDREVAGGLALAEVVFAASPALFSQARICEEVGRRRALAAEGRGPFFYALPYEAFATDIPAHAYVPPHSLITPAERAGLEFAHLLPEALPRVFDNDPPVFWLGARPGDVVRVDHDSLTAGVAPEFRLVVPGRLNRSM